MSRISVPPAARIPRRSAPLRSIVTLAAILGAACGDAASTAPAARAALAVASGGAAVLKLPFAGTTWTPCGNGGAGETIAYDGQLVLVESMTSTATGALQYRVHFHTQGVSAVGQTSGAAYRVIGASDNGYSDPIGPGEEATLVSAFRLVTAGGANDLHMFVSTHITLNADGTRTADVVNTSYECR